MLDSLYLDLKDPLSNLFCSNVEVNYGTCGEWIKINWDWSVVTLGDPMGRNAWRFKLNKYNKLVLYKGKDFVWQPDYNLSCWRDLEYKLKRKIDQRIDTILLEE